MQDINAWLSSLGLSKYAERFVEEDIDLARAESLLESALVIAQSQDAHQLELRAARDLTTVWHDQGRRAEAHDLLARIRDRFTEGSGPAEIQEAPHPSARLA